MAADFDRIADSLENLGPLLRAQARGVVVDLQQAGIAQARLNLTAHGAIDTRATYDGIQGTGPFETDSGWRGEVRATSPQSIFVERGRRAGARMPPGGVLLGWMGRHGIPSSAEFLVRRAIGRRGIRPRPFMAPLGDQLRPLAGQLLAQMGQNVSAILRIQGQER